MPIFNRALELVREANDEVNLGSLLHHVGNCAAGCDQPERALEAYLSAAEQFHRIGMQEYLSTALSETGHLLIDWDSPKPIVESLSEDLFADALQDIANQVAYTFAPNRSSKFEARADAIRKTFGMTALGSFSHSHLLGDWAAELTEHVLRPNLAKIGSVVPENGDKLSWMYLDLTLALARTPAQVPPQGSPRRALSKREVEHYARICIRYYGWGWRPLDPFQWLATYLRRHRGSISYSADSLKATAIAAEESGKPFED